MKLYKKTKNVVGLVTIADNTKNKLFRYKDKTLRGATCSF